MITKRGKSNNFYVRYTVPVHLREAFGPSEVWKTLGTPDRKLARLKEPSVRAAIIAKVMKANSKVNNEEVGFVPNREQLEQAAIQVYDWLVESDWSERAHDPAFVAEFYSEESSIKEVADLRKQMATGDFSAVDEGYWSETFGFQFPPSSILRIEFTQLLMQATVEAAERSVEHDKGVRGGKPSDPLFTLPRELLRRPDSKPAADTSVELEELSLLELYE